MSEKTTTDKARFLVDIWGKSELSRKVGLSRHTLYKRLIEDDWKLSEAMAISSYYDSLKNKKRKEVEDGQG